MSRPIRVRGFATARTALGDRSREIPAPPEGLKLGRLLATLVAEYPRLGPLLPSCRIFLNEELIRSTAIRVRPGDEIALHPPYSGG
ncbi:MAG: MoaD/ThiS family protein [Thermoplasmata archaeon]